MQEKAQRRSRSYANFTAEDIVNLAHEEFIENSVKSIQMKLEKIFNKNEKVELNELISSLRSSPIASSNVISGVTPSFLWNIT